MLHAMNLKYLANKKYCLLCPQALLPNTSTPRVGVSTYLLLGTPSPFLRSKKLWHSIITHIHSARARPAYVLRALDSPTGSTAFVDPISASGKKVDDHYGSVKDWIFDS